MIERVRGHEPLTPFCYSRRIKLNVAAGQGVIVQVERHDSTPLRAKVP